MDFTHKPMKTMVYVDPTGTDTHNALKGWVNKATTYASNLPPK